MSYGTDVYKHIRQLFFIPVEDYNQPLETGDFKRKKSSLYNTKLEYEEDILALENGREWKIKKNVPKFYGQRLDLDADDFIYVHFSKRQGNASLLIRQNVSSISGMENAMDNYRGINLKADAEKQIEVAQSFQET